RPAKAGLAGGSEHTEALPAQAGELGHLRRHVLECRKPVADACRVLEAQIAGESPELRARSRNGVPEILAVEPVQRAGGELCASPASYRPVWPGLGDHGPRIAAPSEVDVALGPRRTGVRGRPQLPDQPQLLERRLELRP